MKKPDAPTALRYVGQGSFLPDVPARGLTADEVSAYDREKLLESGLYVPADPAKVEDAGGTGT